MVLVDETQALLDQKEQSEEVQIRRRLLVGMA
jgi:hypothetical protein